MCTFSLFVLAESAPPRSPHSESTTAAVARYSARCGVVPEPIVEPRRAEPRVSAGGQALIVQRDAVVERLGIGDDRPCVPGRLQESPYEVVLTDRFGAGQVDRAVQRLGEGRVGH